MLYKAYYKGVDENGDLLVSFLDSTHTKHKRILQETGIKNSSETSEIEKGMGAPNVHAQPALKKIKLTARESTTTSLKNGTAVLAPYQDSKELYPGLVTDKGGME